MEKEALTWCVQSLIMIAAKAGLMTETNINELQAMLNDVEGDENDINFLSGVADLLDLYKPYEE